MARTAGLMLCIAVLSTALAQSALTTLQNPGGGQIVYGVVDGADSEAGAMGSILRSLHQRYNDKPQVGKPFQVKGSRSAAVFFTLVKRSQDNGHIAGLVIAAKNGSGKVEAALLSDDAERFGTTVNPMMKTLFASWHPGGAASNPDRAAAPAAALKPYMLPDRSASVSLPESWHVLQNSGAGTILAEGPNGESVALNYPLLAMDSNNPSVRQTMAFAQGAGRNTAYAHALYYPYGGDPGTTLVDLLQMQHKMNAQAPLAMKIDTETPVHGGAGSRCSQLRGHLNNNDGRGDEEFNTVFCVGSPAPMGSYMNLAFHSAVPVAFADRERSTVAAIMNSFQVDMNVVNREAAALAKPAIDQIHAIGRASEEQAAASHAAFDKHNQSVEAQWDSQDKRSQAFSNYLLDQTVISDNVRDGHATVWNETADNIVKSNPSRYSYVDTGNFWKGVDY